MSKMKISPKGIVGIIVGITAVAAGVAFGAYHYATNIEMYDLKKIDKWTNSSSATQITVGFNENDNLAARITNANIKGKDKSLNIDMSKLDIEDGDILTSLDLYNDTFIATYLVDDTFRYNTYVITNSPVTIGNFDAASVENAFNIEDSVETLNYDEDGGVKTSESIGNLYKQGIGYVYDSGLVEADTEAYPDIVVPDMTIDAEALLKKLKEAVKFGDFSTSDIELTIEGIGTANLRDLKFTGETGGIVFNDNNGMAMIYNYESDESVCLVTTTHNLYMLAETDKFIQFMNYNNVYAPSDTQIESSMGHNCIAVMTDAGMYYIKINDNKSLDDIVEILDWLGVKPEDSKIETPFEITGTWDDLEIPTTENIEDSEVTVEE